MSDEIGSLIFRVDYEDKDAVKGLKNFDKTVDEAGDSVKSSEKKITNSFNTINLKAVAMSTAIGAAVYKSIKAIAQATDKIQEGRKTIVYATGASGQALTDLMTVAKDSYTQVNQSFGDVSVAIGEINTRLGLTGKALENTTVKMLRFAEITGQDVQGSIRNVTQLMNQWGIEAEGMPLLLDKLVVAGQQSGIAVNELSQNLIENAGTFKAMGYDMEEAMSLLMSFEKQGINSSAVIMGMKKSFEDSSKAGVDARKYWEALLESIGDTSDKTRANTLAVETFGNRISTTLVSALQEGRISFDEFSEAISGAEGALDETSSNAETSGNKLNKVLKTVETKLAEVGEAIAPYAEKILPPLVDGIKKIADILQPVLGPIGKLTSAVTSLGEASAPILELVAKIAGGAIQVLSKIIEAVAGAISSVTTSLEDEVVETKVAQSVMEDYENTLIDTTYWQEDANNALKEGSKQQATHNDLTSEAVKQEKLLLKAVQDKTEATEESTEATEESAEAFAVESENAEKAVESIKILTAEEKAQAQEREKTAQKYIELLENTQKSELEARAVALEANGDIAEAYKIKGEIIEAEWDKERQALTALYNEGKATTEDLYNFEKAYAIKRRQLEQETAEAISSYEEQLKNERKEYWVSFYNTIKDSLLKLGDAVADYYTVQATNMENDLNRIVAAREADIENYQEYTNERLDILRKANQQGSLSDEEYTKKKQEAEDQLAEYTRARTQSDAKAEEDLKRHINELNRKAFIAQKANSIATTLVNSAEAIVKAYAQLGPVAGSVAAGVIGALTAVQVATISSQQFVPSYSIGAREIPEDQMAHVHAGETILRKTEAQRFRDLGGLYGLERALTPPVAVGAGGINSVNVNSNLSAVIEVDGVQLGVAVLKNIDNASQFVLR